MTTDQIEPNDRGVPNRFDSNRDSALETRRQAVPIHAAALTRGALRNLPPAPACQNLTTVGLVMKAGVPSLPDSIAHVVVRQFVDELYRRVFGGLRRRDPHLAAKATIAFLNGTRSQSVAGRDRSQFRGRLLLDFVHADCRPGIEQYSQKRTRAISASRPSRLGSWAWMVEK
jgi:hypothetical protein